MKTKTDQPSVETLQYQLSEQILSLYRHSVFGKVAKSEIDLKVFSALVKITLQNESGLWGRDQFLWLRVEPIHLRRLSVELRITESRVASLLEQCALAEGAEELDALSALIEIKRLAERFRQDKADLEAGKIRLLVPNRFTRRAIEAFLSSNGSIPETSFHRDHLVIRIGDLLLAAANTSPSDDERTSTFLVKLAEKAVDEANQDLQAEITKALEERSLSDRANKLGKVLTQTVVEKASETGIASIIALITKVVGL